MKTTASPPLTYFPAYVGLFASLALAAACNAFLDIHYRTFGFEVLLWSLTFALTLGLGWWQRGQPSDVGKRGQRLVLVLGLIVTFAVFIPLWGFPRAGLALLATLQAAQNCVTVTRRQLHLGVLVAVAMVLFAASHPRADWTMLFYLVPFIVAVVFTLVSEQVSRRAQDLRRAGLGEGASGGQGAAIVAATAAILMGGALLYALTPQVTWPYLFWKYGQPGNLGQLGNAPGSGQTVQRPGQPLGGRSGNPADGESDRGPGGNGAEGSSLGEDGNEAEQSAGGRPADGSAGANPSPGDELLARSAWPSLKDMHEAARRPGLPAWQSAAIEGLASVAERIDLRLTPIRLRLDQVWKDFKAWLTDHRRELTQSLMALIVFALLLAAWKLLREVRPVVWLLTHLDYLRLGVLRGNATGNHGALQYYRALQRLLDLHDLGRPPAANSREHLAQVCGRYGQLCREAVEFTLLFEHARYGNREVAPSDVARMRELYRRMFRGL